MMSKSALAAIFETRNQRLLDSWLASQRRQGVLQSGRIVQSGGKDLALTLEAEGYAQWPEGNVEVAR